MGAYVSLINGIYSRLKAATATGKKLVRIKKVYLGQAVRVEALTNAPLIMLNVRRLEEKYAAFRGPNSAKVADAVIALTLIYPIQERTGRRDRLAANTADSEATGRGILYMMELIGDTLHETGAGAVDPRVITNAELSMQLTWGEIGLFSDELYQVEAEISIQTAHFTINGRAT